MNGTWGGDLMKEYSTWKTSKVIFNKTHWVSGEVMKVYLHYLHSMFPNESIALVIDRHSAHHGNEYLQSIASVNFLQNPGKKIDTLYIPEGMTAILQVGDVAVNKILKSKIRTIFYKNLYPMDVESTNTIESLSPTTLTPLKRQKKKISRKEFISIVEQAHLEINAENRKTRWIE